MQGFIQKLMPALFGDYSPWADKRAYITEWKYMFFLSL